MPHERLVDGDAPPSDADLIDIIGTPAVAEAWTAFRRWLEETYQIEPLLQFGGKRYGWNVQHRKGGRPLAELYADTGRFTALVILGKKELEQALERLGTFGPTVRKALLETPRYHDGCWMYICVSDPETCLSDVADIQELILIKKKPPKKRS